MTPNVKPPDLLAAVPLFANARQRTGALMSLLQLHWFIRLRWAFVGAALAVLAIERFVSPAAVRPGALALPVLLLAIVNLVWMGWEDLLVRQFHTPGVDEARTICKALLFANAQVAVDLLLLTVILRYTGGVENPMAVFYLFHMAIGALLLKAWHAILQGTWAMLLYAVLATGEWAGRIVPHWDFLPQFPSPGLYARSEYVFALLTVMACGIFATLYFTLHITGRLDERETQLRNAYDALQRFQAAIIDLQRRRARFMQTAAHQLKGPLASIQTLLGLLSDGIVPPESVRSTYDRMAQRCREGAQQVSELLTLARVQEADPRRHPLSVTDAAQVAQDVCRRYESQAACKGVMLECRVPSRNGCYARVDAADLRDCLSNLVENAVKYTNGPGEVRLAVASGMHPDELVTSGFAAGLREDEIATLRNLEGPEWIRDYVLIEVSDSGIGMEPEALWGAEDRAGTGSVFDAFRRGNNVLAAGIPGTGLGLAIVREVVEQAGGKILLRSRLGEGTTFILAIPGRDASHPEQTVRDTRRSIVLLPDKSGVISPRPLVET